ncbi:hypothetical protein [Varibaculum cambriense]|uniref:hypothetical protein n=1 Tax=Varibaculum cambriense TaxID=184870 RepID=UPI00241E13B5|nr:hypothetical protein [Varibaculum cambriense]MBS5963936.1 hypothetical protein [Varibaculum cambriense]
MVGTLIRLNLRLQTKQFTKQWWRIVLGVLAIIYVGFILLGVAIGFWQAGRAGLTAPIQIYYALLIVLVWMMMVSASVAGEQSLTPQALSPYIGPTRRSAYGLLAANIVSVSSCVVFVIYEVSLAGWLAAGSLGASVLTVLSGLLGVFLIGAFTQILQTRLVSRLTAKRASSRQLFTGIGMLVVIALGYLLVTMIQHWFADSGGATAFFPLLVQKLTGSTAQIFWYFLALTPLAPFLLAPFVMAHFYWGLALSLASTCFYGVLILRAWPKVFANALMGRGQVLAEVSPAKNLDASFNENSEDEWRIPLLARVLPLSPVGQIHWARISYYQRKDPRQIMSLSSILYVAVIFGIMLWANHPSGEMVFWALNGTILLVAVTAATALLNMWSNDSSAYWYQIIAGVAGKTDRTVRVGVLASYQLPVMVAITLIFGFALKMDTSAIMKSAILACCYLLVALGANSLISAVVTIPGPAPGQSALRNNSGGSGKSVLATMVSSMAALLLCALPSGLIVLVCVLLDTSWVSLLIAALITAAVLVGGIYGGGKLLERFQVRNLRRVMAWPKHIYSGE